MHVLHAFDTYRQKAAAGLVPDRGRGARPGTTLPKAPQQVSATFGYVRTALESVTGLSGAALDAVEFEPLVTPAGIVDLEKAVRAHYGSQSVNNALSHLRGFISTVLGQDTARRQVVRVESFTAPWRPLAKMLFDHPQVGGDGKPKRTNASNLLFLAEVATRHGVTDPRCLPDDSVTVTGWGVDSKAKERLRCALTDYRRARVALGAAGNTLPQCLIARPQRNRSLTSLRNLPELVARAATRLETLDPDESIRLAGVIASPAAARHEDLVALLAPKLGLVLGVFVDRREQDAGSLSYTEQGVRALSRTLASVFRLGFDPFDWSWERLWQPAASAPQARSGPETREEKLARLYREEQQAAGAVVEEARPSVMRLVADEVARDSAARSPLTVTQAAAAAQVPFYTDTVMDDVRTVFHVGKWGARQTLLNQRRAPAWEAVAAEYLALDEHMRTLTDGRRPSGRLDKGWAPSYAQLLVIGLPRLRARVLAAKRTVDDRRVRGLGFDSHAGRSAVRRYHDRLRRYVICAVILSDTLRLKNYAGARVGAEHQFRPEVIRDAETGAWLGFRSVHTYWTGDADPRVRLKVTHNATGVVNQRLLALKPGVVDLDLLFVYWTEVRPMDLMRAGMIPSTDGFDLDADTWAFFVSSKGGRRRKCDRPDAFARYTEPGLAKEFATGLHWMLREALGDTDVPAALADCRKGKYRGIFGPHIVRAIVATYLGGLRNNWAAAEGATKDQMVTLLRNYSKVSDRMLAKIGLRTVEDPQWFDPLIDVILGERGRQYDWRRFWREFEPARWNPAEMDRWMTILTERSAARVAARGHRGGRRGRYATVPA